MRGWNFKSSWLKNKLTNGYLSRKNFWQKTQKKSRTKTNIEKTIECRKTTESRNHKFINHWYRSQIIRQVIFHKHNPLLRNYTFRPLGKPKSFNNLPTFLAGCQRCGEFIQTLETSTANDVFVREQQSQQKIRLGARRPQLTKVKKSK